jgi:hypothetical protein
VSQGDFKNVVSVMLSYLRLDWGMWQVVGALWLVATIGSWFHFLTLIWIGTSHCCPFVCFWQQSIFPTYIFFLHDVLMMFGDGSYLALVHKGA